MGSAQWRSTGKRERVSAERSAPPRRRGRAERLVGVRRVSTVGDEMPGHATQRQVIAGFLVPRGVRTGTDAGRSRVAEGNGRRPIVCTRNRTDPISGCAKNGDAPDVVTVSSFSGEGKGSAGSSSLPVKYYPGMRSRAADDITPTGLVAGRAIQAAASMLHLSWQVPCTDLSGIPLDWVDYRSAGRLYSLGQVAYGCGDRLFLLHGGINAATKRRSTLEVNSIIATHGICRALNKLQDDYVPPLSNRTRRSFALASAFLETLLRIPLWYNSSFWARGQTSISRRPSRWVNCAKACAGIGRDRKTSSCSGCRCTAQRLDETHASLKSQ